MTEQEKSANAASPAAASASAGPPRFCDLVMKGGVSSGIVYPAAVSALKDEYTFKSIGGTSAGAMAAAATAAAEYGRQHGHPGGFEELSKLHDWFAEKGPGGEHSNLFALFQPERATRPIYNVLLAGVGARRWKYTRMIARLLAGFWGFALLGAGPGLVLLKFAWDLSRGAAADWGWYRWVIPALGGALAVLGAFSGAVAGCVLRISRTIPANGYGLCSGHSASKSRRWFGLGGRRPVALTDWLTDYLDTLAGRPLDGPPLTFGDLWGPGGRDDPAIRLEMMTTNVTHSRPYRLPDLGGAFYFNPAELGRLFPERVVSWMERNPDPASKSPEKYAKLGLRRMPAPAQLPVVVAARMSLALPVVLSAVPLHAVDFGVRRYPLPDGSPRPLRPERSWFSDGGTCSNFPVHFFDSYLPRWPTFAINLRSFHPADERHVDQVWMPEDNSRGLLESWNRFETGGGLKSSFGFLMACVEAARNWMDSSQSRLPGYRDRIVHVALDDETEGGMNLGMPREVIDRLAGRGRAAGAMLRERFAAPRPGTVLDWDNHRWIRYRTTMALLEQMLEEIDRTLDSPPRDERSYLDLAARGKDDAPLSYPWSGRAQRQYTAAQLRRLRRLVRAWTDAQHAKRQFRHGKVPQPRPALRISPPL